jgi:hypothetical protein
MTRRIVDRERLKRAIEDGKRALEQARPTPGRDSPGAPPRPPGERGQPDRAPERR